jgi:putative flippase GtrA
MLLKLNKGELMTSEVKNWIIIGLIGVIVVIGSFSVSYDGSTISSKISKFLHADSSVVLQKVDKNLKETK